MTTSSGAGTTGDDHAGPGRWFGLALGLPVIAWGIRGVLMESARTHPAELGRWLVGSAVIHDAVVLPIVLLVGAVARRTVSDRAWPVVRWALATSGVLLLVSWPFVRGYGQSPANPSVLPRAYGTGVLLALAAVWAVSGAMLLMRRSRTATNPEPERGGEVEAGHSERE
jgi:hypothetical protein